LDGVGMARRFGVVFLVAAALLAGAYTLWISRADTSAAGPVRKTIIPAIAMDSVAPTTSSRDVIVSVRLLINEPAFVTGAFTEVEVAAVARGPLPGPLDPPVTVSAWMQITTHPGDVCAWGAWVNGNLSMTYSQPQGSNLQLQMNFSGAEWYYRVECPAETIRFPAGNVNESLTGWLGLIFPGLGGPTGAVIDTPPHTGGLGLPECVKRVGHKVGAGFGGQGEIIVLVTQPPCMTELGPAASPGPQNPAYDPGGF
jgi:hypothetical protein